MHEKLGQELSFFDPPGTPEIGKDTEVKVSGKKMSSITFVMIETLAPLLLA